MHHEGGTRLEPLSYILSFSPSALPAPIAGDGDDRIAFIRRAARAVQIERKRTLSTQAMPLATLII